MSTNSLLRGVSGWLALLVGSLIALAPMAGFSRLLQELEKSETQFPALLVSGPWQQYKQLSWCVFGVTAAISIAAGYRLWKIHFVESVRFAILALWLIGPLGNLGYVAVTWFVAGTDATVNSLPEFVGAIVGSAIAAGIWTAYLKMSVRVRNTYAVPIQSPNQT